MYDALRSAPCVFAEADMFYIDDITTGEVFIGLDQLFDDICQELDSYSNYRHIAIHFDTYRICPAFQALIGIGLEEQGVSTSTEALEDVRNKISAVVAKIRDFFSKILDWFNKTFKMTVTNAKALVDRLVHMIKDNKNKEAIAKNYTTLGAAVGTFDTMYRYVTTELKRLSTALNETRSKKNGTDIEASLNTLKEKDPEVVKAFDEFTASNKKGGEDGVSPTEGGWFDESKLNALSATMTTLGNVVTDVRTIQSSTNALLNDLGSASYENDDARKRTLDVAKLAMKEMKEMTKNLHTSISFLGKKCQSMLKSTQATKETVESDKK